MFLNRLSFGSFMDLLTIFLRLGIVLLFSLVFGLMRQRSHKPIGFGTFVFVSMGACALSIIAVTLPSDNPLPLLGSIVTGIGFLGAGALIKNSDRISGFTSAASIWIFAIWGLVVGIGDYVIGAALYGTLWVVLMVDKYLEERSIGVYERKIIIITNRIIPSSEFEKVFAGNKHRLLSIEVNKADQKMTATFRVEGLKTAINHIPKELLAQSWFVSCKVE